MKIDPNAIDLLFSAYDRKNTPGGVLAVIHEGQIVYQRGYGMADLERGVPLTPDSVFDIASTGKQFTAFIVLALAQQGKLDLEAPLRQYLPELHPCCDPVRVHNLLHHSSGLRDYCTLMELAGMPVQNYYPEGAIFDLISRQRSLCFFPGEEFLYSNTGYFLFNRIVQLTSGRTLLELIREWIFEPLGMKHSTFNDDFSRIVPKRALAYNEIEAGTFHTNISFLGGFGDGTVLTTVGDLYLWDQNFYHNQLCGGEQSLIEQMQTCRRLNNGEPTSYACGLEITKYRGLELVQHSGSWAGYRSQFMRFPDKQFSVIVLSNLSTANPSQLGSKVADICLAKYFLLPARSRLETIVREYPPGLKNKLTGYYRCERTECLLELGFEVGMFMLTLEGEKLPLVAIDQSRFMPKNPDYAELSITQEEGEESSQPAVILQWEGEKPERYDKLPALPELAVQELAEYAGRYYSDELSITSGLDINEDRLIVIDGYAQSSSLNQVTSDLFIRDQIDLRFERDTQGNVVKYWLGAGRLRNIEFRRMQSP
jgi:CubicO group peptidase (beta-lactamase class C family)